MTTFLSAPTYHHHHVRHPPKGLGELRKSIFFFGSKSSTLSFGRRNSTNWLFSNLKNPPRTLPVNNVTHIPQSHFLSGLSVVTSLNETSAPHAREHLRSCLHLTNPCAKWKVLNLTKPKGRYIKRNPSAIILQWVYTINIGNRENAKEEVEI